MRLICGTCQEDNELPEGFFDGAAITFWHAHGHVPIVVTFRCEQCGAEYRLDGAAEARALAQTGDLAKMKQFAEQSHQESLTFYLTHLHRGTGEHR